MSIETIKTEHGVWEILHNNDGMWQAIPHSLQLPFLEADTVGGVSYKVHTFQPSCVPKDVEIVSALEPTAIRYAANIGTPKKEEQPIKSNGGSIEEDYACLKDVLNAAYKQASEGKGAERHACSRAFDEQPMQLISELLDSDAGMAFQAIKKIQEARRMDSFERYERELLGAINYIAGMIIHKKKLEGK